MTPVWLILSALFAGAAADTACINLGGKCQTNTIPCRGGYLSGKCAGPAWRQCCRPGPTGDYRCISQGGSCQDDWTSCHDEEGRYISGQCAGGYYRRCCLDPCSEVRVISRKGWGARTPRGTSSLTTPVSKVFIHHTVGTRCYNSPDCISEVKAIQNFHMDTRGWSDIGYSFLVGDDGFIYEGRGWKTQGAHTRGCNDESIALSFMGDYTSQLPSAKAIEAAKAFIACSVGRHLVSEDYTLMGHRDAVGSFTHSPGHRLYREIQSWTHFSRTD